jgi:hypothetical protein
VFIKNTYLKHSLNNLHSLEENFKKTNKRMQNIDNKLVKLEINLDWFEVEEQMYGRI